MAVTNLFTNQGQLVPTSTPKTNKSGVTNLFAEYPQDKAQQVSAPLSTPQSTNVIGQAQNLITNVTKAPVVGQVIQFAKDTGSKALSVGASLIKSSVTQPKKTATGAVEGVAVELVKFGGQIAKLVQDGYKKQTLITQPIPDRWDMSKQLPAFNELVAQKLKEKNVDEQNGFMIGQFIGTIIPYEFGSAFASATIGSKVLLPAAAEFVPQAVKFIPAINNAIGFLGIGQIEYDKKEDETRVDKLKNDLVMLGLFEAGSVLVNGLTKGTKNVISKFVNNAAKDIKGNGADIAILEKEVQVVKEAIKKDTGQEAGVVLTNNMTKATDKEIKLIENKTKLLEAPKKRDIVEGKGFTMSEKVDKSKLTESKATSVPQQPSVPKTSGVAKQIEAKAVEKGMVDKGYTELAQYDSSTIKAQSKAASKYSIDDMNKIATGETQLPKELKPGTPLSIAEDYAIKNNDIELLRKLANSPLATQISESASELSLSRMRDTNSPVKIMREVEKVKEEAFKKRYAGKSIKEVRDTVVADIKKKVKAPDKYDWNNFVKSLPTC